MTETGVEDSDHIFISGFTICLSAIGADLYSFINALLQNDLASNVQQIP
jgi:hypothetical protein